MEDQVLGDNSSRRKTSDMATVSYKRNMPKKYFVASRKSSGQVVLSKNGRMGTNIVCDAAMFLLKVGVLEMVRRLSRARCPFIWSGIQALQVLCYSPLKWIENCGPFKGLVNGMQMLSKPLTVLNIATAFSDQSENNVSSANVDESHGPNDSHELSEPNTELPSVESTQDTSVPDKDHLNQSSKSWLFQLYTELENQGIRLPERLNEDELHRFYMVANGNFGCLLSSVKKAIHWRETYHILSEQKLDKWSHLVFWHGFDVKKRRCLFVRLGLACTKLPSCERPRFVQAVVSQVEHGVLHFIDPENPQICVLVDCDGLSPMESPMQMLKACITTLQEHFPNRLGLLLVIRLPPVVRVILHTFIQVLSPSTRERLKIYGEKYQQFLIENFQTLPSYLGNNCMCRRCLEAGNFNKQQPIINRTHETEEKTDFLGSENLAISHTNFETDKYMNGCFDHVLRSAVVGILVFWVLIALIAGIYDPTSRPRLTL